LTVTSLNHLDRVFFALAATAATPTGTPCPGHSPGSGPISCSDSKILPISYRHNTGGNGPEEFKLIVQHHAARSGKKARRGGARGQAHKEEHAVKAERVHHTGRRSRTDRYAAAIAKSQRPSSPSLELKQGTSGKGKARSGSNGGTSAAPIDVDDLEDTHMPVGQDNGWPEATRARFERNLPVFVSPTFGGKPPVRIAHAVVAELYLCPIEDVDAEMAGVAVKGACDSQVRGFMLTSRTLSSAQVSEWLCSSMSADLRRATLLWQQRRREQIPRSNTDNTEEKDPKGRPPERT